MYLVIRTFLAFLRQSGAWPCALAGIEKAVLWKSIFENIRTCRDQFGRLWEIMLKKYPIMLCSNALNCS